jgi:TolA-binding protein
MFKKVFVLIIAALSNLAMTASYTYAQGGGSSEVEAEKILKYGKALYEVEHHDKAVDTLLQIICFYPNSKYYDEALYLIGECLINEGRLAVAKTFLERLIKEKPESAYADRAKENLKLLATLTEDWEQYWYSLEDKLCDLILSYGLQAQARSMKNTEYGVVFEDKEFKEALRLYQLAETLFPNSIRAPKACYLAGEAYRARNTYADYEKAINEYKKVVEKYPNSIWANRALKAIGDICRDNLGDKKRAIEAYQALIERNKHIPNSYWVSYAETQLQIIK